MFNFIFLALPFLILAAAATTPTSVLSEAPQLLEPVDVLFFQAFVLVPNPDKVTELRNMLKESLSKKRTEKDLNPSGFSDSPLFLKAISMGFERHSNFNKMGISESSPLRGISALDFYHDNLSKALNRYPTNGKHTKKFQMSKYLMEDFLFTNHVLNSIRKHDGRLTGLAVKMIANSYHTTSSIDQLSFESNYHYQAIPFQLSSPQLSSIPLPSPQLSLKIFSDWFPKDQTFGKIEKYFADNWGKYVGERASLVEEMIINKKLPTFEKGIRSLLGSNCKHSEISCAVDLAIAKAYNITGYLPFPNYRAPNELYLNSILQARMLLKSPELQQANTLNLGKSFEKSIDATQIFLGYLPSVPFALLTANLD